MKGIRKTFPGVVALDHVDLDLRRGEVHILLGENGAGKSTLMKILSGAYRADSGEILLDGHSIEIGNPRNALRMGISTIYQEFNLIPHLTVAENIFLGNEPLKFPGVIDQKKMSQGAWKLLAELGVQIDPNIPVRKLVVAEQQMVEVAKALSIDARILIMDEPTSALTETEIRELFSAIRRLKTRGVAIIYISHRLEELFEIGDRVTVLRDGKHVATMPIDQASTRELVRLMADREIEQHFPRKAGPPGEEVLRIERLSAGRELRDISFCVRRGEIVGMAGLLGAGRTALARVLFGLESIRSGQVCVRGRKTRIDSPAQAIRNGIGYLTENRKKQGLVMVLSVQENLSLPSLGDLSRWGWLSSSAEERLAQKFVRKLNIKTPTVRQRVMYLSGGNQQKVVLSKWLARDSDVFIFDEPTRGIDVGGKVEIYQLMNRLTESGAGILMISSELPEVLGMSDRILVMREGRICAEFTSDEASQEAILSAALGQPPEAAAV